MSEQKLTRFQQFVKTQAEEVGAIAFALDGERRTLNEYKADAERFLLIQYSVRVNQGEAAIFMGKEPPL